MTDTLTQRLEIVGQDMASEAIRDVIRTLRKLDAVARKTGVALKGAMGGDIAKQFAQLRDDAHAFGVTLTSSAGRAEKALRADAVAANDLGAALRRAVAEQRRLAQGAKTTRSALSTAAAVEAKSMRNAARSARTAWGPNANAHVRYFKDLQRQDDRANRARDKQIREEVKLQTKRERLERDAMRREQATQRRTSRAFHRSMHKTWEHGHRAVSSMSHPFFSSPAFLAMSSLTAALYELTRVVKGTMDLDTAKTKYGMMGFREGTSQDDIRAGSTAMTKKAMDESLRLGTGSDHLLNIVTEAIRSGVPKDLATEMMGLIPKAAGAMGEDAEKLSHNMAEAIQQAVGAGLIKNKDDLNRFLNVDAGMSNYGGMTAQKMDEFWAAGGLGRGRELGLNDTQTMGIASMFGALGARTGQFDARILGQISNVAPTMKGTWAKSLGANPFDNPEGFAVSQAPRKLGYGNIDAMQKALESGPKGLIEFFGKVGALGPSQSKLIMRGYGFGEGADAAAAEIAANPARAQSFMDRAEELAKQKKGQDYLTEKWKSWTDSLQYMMQQFHAGMEIIEYQLGEPLKDMILTPIRDAWVQITAGLTSDDIRGNVKESIRIFLESLGIHDLKQSVLDLAESLKGHDIAGFLKGVGEGIKALYDGASVVFNAISKIAGEGSAESTGKLVTELLGLSLALHAVAPVIGIIGALGAAFMTLKAALGLGASLAAFTGITTNLKALLSLDLAGGAAGLMTLAGSIGALIGLAGLAAKQGILAPPKSMDMRGFLDFLDPNLGDMFLGTKPGSAQHAGPHSALKNADRDFRKMIEKDSYNSGDNGWAGLIQKASYQPSDSGEVVKESIVGTEQAVNEVKDELVQTNQILKASLLGMGGGSGGGGGGSDGGGGGSGASGGGESGSSSGGGTGRGGGGGGTGRGGGGGGGGSTPAKGALKANQLEAYKAARGEGLSDKAARAMVANMSGESLRNPADKHWDLTHMAQGIVQWDPERSEAIKKQFGKYPKDMSVTEQTKAAIWEIRNNKRFAPTARALAGDGSSESMLGTLVSNYEAPRDKVKPYQDRLAFLRGFDPNAPVGGGKGGSSTPDTAMSGGVGERLASLKKSGLLSDQQCVTLAMGAVGIRKNQGEGGNVHQWRKGDAADAGDLKEGTPISTFLNRDGTQSNRYAGGGSGTEGAHLDHAAVFQKYLMDDAGKRIGMQVAEQYRGSHGIHNKDYYFGRGRGEGNGSNYFAIRDSKGNYLGGDNNPMTVKVDPKSVAGTNGSPAGTAGQIPTRERPDPTAGAEPASTVKRGTNSADASQGGQGRNGHTFNMAFHHQVSDPSHLARLVGKEIDSRVNERTHDVDHYIS